MHIISSHFSHGNEKVMKQGCPEFCPGHTIQYYFIIASSACLYAGRKAAFLNFSVIPGQQKQNFKNLFCSF